MAKGHQAAALRLEQATRRLLDQEERERADVAEALAQQLSSNAIEDELERGDAGR